MRNKMTLNDLYNKFVESNENFKGNTTKTMKENIQNYNNAIVLMHDANDKVLTVEALPMIIEKLQAMGNVEILPITEQTTMIQHTTLEKE